MEKTRRVLRHDRVLSKFEKTRLIAFRAREITEGAQPYIENFSTEDVSMLATHEFYLGHLNGYRIRRTYPFSPTQRLHREFIVGDLCEPTLAGSGPLARTSYSSTMDLYGNPACCTFWREQEIDACIGVLMDATPLPGGKLPQGHETANVPLSPFFFVCEALQASLRAFVREEIRRHKIPNSVQDIYRTAVYIARSYNLAMVTPGQMVGEMLNDVVVDPQGVISSFHSIGRRMSALSMQMAAEQLISGNFKQHGDYLVVNGRMDPRMAIQCDRSYSEVRFNELATEHTVISRDGLAGCDDALYNYFIGDKPVYDSFVRFFLKRKILCWNEVLLTDVAAGIQKASAEFGVVVVPHTQRRAMIDVFFLLREYEDCAMVTHEYLHRIIPRLRFPITPNSVKGVTAYTYRNLINTSYVLQEIPRSSVGDKREYMWHVDVHEYYINCPGQPLQWMLRHIDPDAVYEPMDQEPLHQYRVEISNARMLGAMDALAREREKTLHMALDVNNHLQCPDEEDKVRARVMGRQTSTDLTPLSLMNAWGEEMLLQEDLEYEKALRTTLQLDPAVIKNRAALFRAMTPRTRHPIEFTMHYRQTVLITTGSNLLDNIFTIPNADETRCVPVNCTDTYSHLGCEAMRQQLLRILVDSFAKKSKKADPVHLVLTSHIMTHRGYLTKLSDILPMENVLKSVTRSRGMFEFSNAALKQSEDDAMGVLASQVLGQTIVAGTGGMVILPPTTL